MTQTTVAPITKTIIVRCSPERAFTIWTQEMDTWWPYATHSMLGARDQRTEWGPRPGGAIEEVAPDGERCAWGSVLVWEPPHKLVYTMHTNPDWPEPTEVEINFERAEGGTRVVLVHRGWERIGDKAAASRPSYDAGWDTVLPNFVEVANKS